MNVVITLPEYLIKSIVLGEKLIEMRKSRPWHLNEGRDGFFACQKGTKKIICWCRIDSIDEIKNFNSISENHIKKICVGKSFIERYMKQRPVYFWNIGKVIVFEKPLSLEELFLERAPQSFAYAPLSYGESY